jgi:methyl-accepting chemotaxis protein
MIKDEVAKATSQLQQVRSVLADAVARITTSFDTLRRESDAQRELMGALMSTMVREGGGTADRKHLSGQAFAREAGAVLQQFTDMLAAVSQESASTVHRIDEIAKKFDEVSKLVEHVNEIAEATLVLAVNASIQAANAKGTHGQTFGVIASNVRDLSRKTQRFNGEIGQQIDDARDTIDRARKTMSEMASRDLEVAMRSQQRVRVMLDGLSLFEAFTKESIERANDAATRIAGAASQAITALQFEDIVEQILGNVQQRIARVAGLAPQSPAPDAPVLRDPVQQTSVASGDVELF